MKAKSFKEVLSSIWQFIAGIAVKVAKFVAKIAVIVAKFVAKIASNIKSVFTKDKAATKKVIKTAFSSLIWLVFAISLLTMILTFDNTRKVPNIFGFGYLSVQSSSMSGTFEKGDLIFVTTTNDDSVFEINDIVTFDFVLDGYLTLNTHTIVGIETINGTNYYTTKGEANPDNDTGVITATSIVAKYTGHRLPGFGKAVDYVQSRDGFLLCVVIPLALMFIYQLVNFAIIMSKYRQLQYENAALDVNKLTDEQKEEIAKKYMESLNAKKE